MNRTLTDRQLQLLNFIRQYMAEYEQAPSYREMAEALGLSDVKNIQEHLQRLELKGCLTRQVGRRRSIELLSVEDQDGTPVYGKVAAGLPLDIAADVDRMINIPDGLFRVKPDFLLQVAGDSMTDIGIYDGDLAGVKRCRTANHGQIVVAMVDVEEMSRAELKECGLSNTGITLKRIAISGNKILLKSENRDMGYAPIVVRPERVRIEGRYVGLVRGG